MVRGFKFSDDVMPRVALQCCCACGKDGVPGQMEGWRKRERLVESGGTVEIMCCSDACEAYGESKKWFKPKPPPYKEPPRELKPEPEFKLEAPPTKPKRKK